MAKLVEELTDLQICRQKHALNATGKPCVAMHAVGGSKEPLYQVLASKWL